MYKLKGPLRLEGLEVYTLNKEVMMTHLNDYNTLLPILQALDKKEIWKPRIPVDVAAQEGENLYVWSLKDKVVLQSHGLDGDLIDSLPLRAGALRQAESNLLITKGQQQEARKIWTTESEEAMELRYTLLRIFRFAFKNNPEALSRLSKVKEGTKQSDYVVDLDRLADLGTHYITDLEAIHFEIGKLDEARELAKSLGTVLSKYQTAVHNIPGVDIRNRAYTYLQMAVVEVRAYGKFAFHNNPEKQSGYITQFKPSSKKGKTTEDEIDDAEPLMPDTELGT